MHFTKEFLSMIFEEKNEAVKLIIENRRLHHAIDAKKSSLLHYAAKRGNKVITKYLLDRGCCVDAQNIEKETPLMFAVQNHKGEIVEMLLNAGADIEIENVYAENALNIAYNLYPDPDILVPLFRALKTKYSHLDIAEKLINDSSSIQHVVYLGDAKIIECMLMNGFPVEDSSDGQFPLHQAVQLANLKIVKVLLKYGADIELRDGHGATPLNFLYQYNEEHTREKSKVAFDILKVLLRLGASLTTCTKTGLFQVCSTLIYGCNEALRLVLQSKINFTAKEKRSGRTILHYLARNLNHGVVDVLKPYIKKFDINAINQRGYKPIDSAVKKANVDMVKILLDEGTKTDAALFYVYSTFKRKLEASHDKCAKLLLQSGANPQSVYTGRTGRKYTIFDIAKEEKYFNRMKIALAELAIREKKGVKITSLTYSKINAYSPFKTYFENCRQLLTLEIVETVSFFELVTADEKKVNEYLRNDGLVQQLKRISQKDKFKSTFSYYNDILNERFATGS